MVKMPDGQRLSRRFAVHCLLQVVVDWIESCDPGIYDFDLASNYPRHVYGPEQRTSTLDELGLAPQALLFTQQQGDGHES